MKELNEDYIEITDAYEHNLKHISLSIPRDRLVVITGISGSGKSSLAFDTIYAEGQRRYMETFSAYARQFLGTMDRPEVEKIDGLSPVISIEQKTTAWNPRSTVGTTTEIYDFFRLLYARAGEAYSYKSGKKMVQYTEEEILNEVQKRYTGKKIVVLAPMVRSRKGHYRELFEQVRKKGYTKVRVDGDIIELVEGLKVDRFKVHDIELVVDRIKVDTEKTHRLRESVATAMDTGDGSIYIMDHDTEEVSTFSKHLMDDEHGISYDTPSPNSFSFNSPYGSCKTCKGLGWTNNVDLNKVIPDDSKSIEEIGIKPFGEVRKNTTFTQLRKLGRKYGFTFKTPIKEISKEAMDIILYGSKKRGRSKYDRMAHDLVYDLEKEGIAHMLERWYQETTSERIRVWAEEYMTVDTCTDCDGYRLKKESLHFKIDDHHIGELAVMDLSQLYTWMEGLESRLSDRQNIIGKDLIKEIRMRLSFLLDVGLDYLSLNRPTRTLSGGESQRTRLATQIGSQLTGITYIMDEPSIGLHQRDNTRLINALKNLTEIGNSVIVVEHDKDIMLASDYLIDLGPGAGVNGGDIVAQGSPDVFCKLDTATARYLRDDLKIEIPKTRRKGTGKTLSLKGASGNNLQNVSIDIPLGTFVCITGVSGSGKSTLINETLYPILRQHFYKSVKKPLAYKSIEGMEHLDKVIDIDQSPIGRTPRSNPATYTGVFDKIRKLFTELPEAKIRGYKPGRFSFNVKDGRCETCKGAGKRVIEMNFLPDVYVECETCMGKRYNRETLEIIYKGKTISDVLDMPVHEAVVFFEAIPSIHRVMKTLDSVGLGYITLGQQATTLSGGEAQRVKLSQELSKRDTGKTIYILDEPTTGLHFQDIQHLINVLNRLVEKGNTVMVIEHNMDIIKIADHIVDIGPEGGRGGGQIVAQGTPEKVARSKKSHTARYLKEELK